MLQVFYQWLRQLSISIRLIAVKCCQLQVKQEITKCSGAGAVGWVCLGREGVWLGLGLGLDSSITEFVA